MGNKVEYHFLLPFEQLIYKTEYITCKELYETSDFMKIKIDMDLLFKKYSSYRIGEGDILVFSNKYDTDSFIMFDFYRGYCDQHDMVKIGVRCYNDAETIKHVLSSLYDKGQPRSKFIIDDRDNLKSSLNIENFPKEIKDDGVNEVNYQHIEYYVEGVLTLRK